jgi:hypothetical protein
MGGSNTPAYMSHACKALSCISHLLTILDNEPVHEQPTCNLI